jgi:hypothetical protein
VRLEGPGACHEGYRTCFFRRIATGADGTLEAAVVEERVFDPETVYGSAPPNASERTPVAAERQRSEQDAAFERAVRELYAAYERLRDDDHTATSATSALLHRPDREAAASHALRRGLDELGELRGVVAGTHRHRGGDADVILEAGQVQYWAMVAAVAAGCPYDAWRPHEIWLAEPGTTRAEPVPPADAIVDDCKGLILAAADQCREAGVDPARVVAADLAAMRAKHASGNA